MFQFSTQDISSNLVCKQSASQSVKSTDDSLLKRLFSCHIAFRVEELPRQRAWSTSTSGLAPEVTSTSGVFCDVKCEMWRNVKECEGSVVNYSEVRPENGTSFLEASTGNRKIIRQADTVLRIRNWHMVQEWQSIVWHRVIIVCGNDVQRESHKVTHINTWYLRCVCIYVYIYTHVYYICYMYVNVLWESLKGVFAR